MVKKYLIILSALIIVITSAVFIFNFGGFNVNDKYIYTVTNVKDCIDHSDVCVVAEYKSSRGPLHYTFKVNENLKGDIEKDEEFYIKIWEEIPYSTDSYSGSKDKSNKNEDFRNKFWTKDNLLVELIPGKEYFIVGVEMTEYYSNKRIMSYVILDAEYPFNEEFYNESIVKYKYENIAEYTKLYLKTSE